MRTRGFTLLEITVVGVCAAIVGGVAMVGVSEAVRSAQAKSGAAQFLEFVRQQRTEQIIAGNYSYIAWGPSPTGGGTTVTVAGLATGSGGQTPCQLMAGGAGTRKSMTFPAMNLGVVNTLPNETQVSSACITPSGQPYDNTLQTVQSLRFELNSYPTAEELVTLDENGVLASTLSPVKDGMAQSMFHFNNDLVHKPSADLNGATVGCLVDCALGLEPKTGDPVYKDAVTMVEIAPTSFALVEGSCFAAGTLVQTPHGPVAIETLKVGDEVIGAGDEGTGDDGAFRVKETFTNMSSDVWVVTIAGKEMTATGGHPFFVEGLGFVHAAELIPGMRVRTLRHGMATVDAVRRTDESRAVYNIHVTSAHTYFVGDDGVLVHNVSYLR